MQSNPLEGETAPQLDTLEEGYKRELATEPSFDDMLKDFEAQYGPPAPEPTASDAARAKMAEPGYDSAQESAVSDALASVQTGVATAVQDGMNAVLDLKDWLANNPVSAETQKRDRYDFADTMYQPKSLPGAATKAATQFLTAYGALKGLGTIARIPQAASGVAAVVRGAGTGALADFITTDPKTGNLSKLLHDAGLRPAVVEFLMTKDDDSNAAKRFKGAVEGLVPGILVDGLVYGLRAIKGARKVEQVMNQPKALEAPKAEAKAAGTVETPGVVPGALEPKPLPDGVTIRNAGKDGAVELEAVDKDGKVIGTLNLASTGEDVPPFVQGVEVDKEWRRKGVATAMYQEADKIAGGKLMPSPDQTPEAKALWEKTFPERTNKVAVENEMVVALAKDLGITPAQARQRLVIVEGKPQDYGRVTGADADKFVEITEATDTTPATFRLNLLRMSSDKDVKKALAATEQVFKADIDKMVGGPVSWAQTEKEAKELLGNFEWVADLKDTVADTRRKMAAARILVANSAKTVFELGAAASKEGTDVARAALMQGLEVHRAIQAQVSGARSEMGRGLNAMKAVAEADDDVSRAQAIDILIKAGGGRTDVDSVIKMMEDIGRSKDPVLMAKFIADTQKLSYGRRLWEAAYEARRGLMLAGINVNVLNTVSNALMLPSRIVEKRVAERIAKRAGLDPTKVDLGDTVVAGEAAIETQALVSGLRDMFVYAAGKIPGVKTKSTATSMAQAARGGTAKALPGPDALNRPMVDRVSWQQLAPKNKSTRQFLEAFQLDHITDFIGAGTRVGFNTMGAADDIFKSLNYRMGIHAAAHREAARRGLKGADREALMQTLVDTPIPDVHEVGLADALKWTLNEDLVGGGRAFEELVKSTPARWLIPFTKTNINAFSYALQSTPALNKLSHKLQADLAAGGATAQMAQARMQVGRAAILLGAGFGASGFMTGGGPRNPEDMRRLKATGWKPYALKFGDAYVSIGQFHPLTKVLGMGADMFEFASDALDGDGDQLGDGVVAAAAILTHGMTPEFLVQTLGNFMQLYDGTQASQSKVLEFINRSANPLAFTGISREVRNFVDPEIRDTRVASVPSDDDATVAWEEMKNLLAASSPFGGSKNLPARLDVFGEPLKWTPHIAGVTVSLEKDDPVNEELVALRLTEGPIADKLAPGERDITIQMPDRIIQKRSGVLNIPIKLGPQEYHDLIQLSAGKPVKGVSVNGKTTLKAELTTLIKSPAYQKLSDQGKRLYLYKTVSAYQSAAKQAIFQVHPELIQQGENFGEKAVETFMKPPTKRSPQSTRKGAYPTL